MGEHFNGRFNNIARLPPGVGEWASLKTLWLGHNSLAGLPPALNWPLLAELDLRKNDLVELPEALTACTSLKRLHLGANALTALPPNLLESLTGLCELQL